jgi:hypothetical protein
MTHPSFQIACTVQCSAVLITFQTDLGILMMPAWAPHYRLHFIYPHGQPTSKTCTTHGLALGR